MDKRILSTGVSAKYLRMANWFISILELLSSILALVIDRLKQLGTFCEKTAAGYFDAIMDTALQCVGLSKNKFAVA